MSQIRAAFAVVILFAITTIVSTPARAQGRDGAPERPRLLLVFAPNEDNKSLVQQYQSLEQDTGEINSEDVDVVYVIGDRSVKLPPPDSKTETAENMRKRYHVDTTGFRVVLIGHDGWEKARWSEPTDPHVIVSHAADMPRPKSALDDKK
jgi:hypothetical protein